MNGTSQGDPLVHAFEEQRGHLIGVAYRMLGSRTDAEDAVQEAWLRLARQDADSIDNLGGWLTTVVSRVCIDMLRSRKARPEASYDDRLPELVVTEDTDAGPEDHAIMADSVGLALMVVLDTLRPAERLAFVLHDMFAVPFREIGPIIGTSEGAAKMLASRARRKVQTTRRPSGDLDQQRSVVDAFLAASRAGDFDRLCSLLDPDVTWRIHTTRGLVIKRGATDVAARWQRAARARGTARRVLVNGASGIAAWNPEGRLRAVMGCTVADGRIVEMESVTDPRQLRHIDLPASQETRG
jgi:RNA polymerase sigma factor (sigma-70 family)